MEESTVVTQCFTPTDRFSLIQNNEWKSPLKLLSVERINLESKLHSDKSQTVRSSKKTKSINTDLPGDYRIRRHETETCGKTCEAKVEPSNEIHRNNKRNISHDAIYRI